MENLSPASSSPKTQENSLTELASAFIQFDMEEYKPTNLSDLIDAILFQNGLICPSDLRRILGLSKKSLERYITSRNKNNCLIKYEDNTVDKIIYGFDITKNQFKCFARDYKCNFRYSDAPLSAKSVGHAYYSTLNNLQICLFSMQIKDITTRSFYEVLFTNDKYYPTSSYAPGDAVLDLVCFVYKLDCLNKALLFEQDMGNESIATLHKKLINYANHNTLSNTTTLPSIVFSFQKTHERMNEYDYDKDYQFKNTNRKHWSLSTALVQNPTNALDYALTGVECWTVPTMYLQDYLPYIIWESIPEEIQQLCEALEPVTGELEEPMSSDFYKCRHTYNTFRGYTIYFEYIDADVFSILRVINHLSHKREARPDRFFIVMIFDHKENFTKLINLVQKWNPQFKPSDFLDNGLLFVSRDNLSTIYSASESSGFFELLHQKTEEDYPKSSYIYTQDNLAKRFNVSINNISKHISRHSTEFDFSAHSKKLMHPDTNRYRVYYDQEACDYLSRLISYQENGDSSESVLSTTSILTDSNITVDYNDLLRKYNDLLQKNNDLIADNNNLQTEVSKSLDKVLKINSQYEAALSENKSLQNSYTSIKAERDTLLTRCSSLTTQLNETQKKLYSLKKYSDKLQTAASNANLLHEKYMQLQSLNSDLERLIKLFSEMYFFDYTPLTTDYRHFYRLRFSIKRIPFYILRWLCCWHNPMLKDTKVINDYYGAYLYNRKSHRLSDIFKKK